MTRSNDPAPSTEPPAGVSLDAWDAYREREAIQWYEGVPVERRANAPKGVPRIEGRQAGLFSLDGDKGGR